MGDLSDRAVVEATATTLIMLPPLLTLPNELLHHIIDSVSPDDIVNFALCCKDVHTLAIDSLKVHRERVQMFTKVAFKDCYRHTGVAHPVTLLIAIHLDWKVAYYPKSICISYYDIVQTEEVIDVDETRETPDSQLMRIAEEDCGEGFLESRIWDLQHLGEDVSLRGGADECGRSHRESVMKRTFCHLVRRGDRAVMYGLLLASLPNLDFIFLSKHIPENLKEIVRYIAAPVLTRGNPASLTKLEIYGSDEGTISPGERIVNIYEQFIVLPSMRTLYGRNMCGLSEWTYPLPISNVTDVCFEDCNISAAEFSHLFRGLRALKKFTYDYNPNLDWDDDGPETYGILAALREHAGRTLEYLSLTNLGSFERSVDDGSLRDFCVLKEAEADCAFYTGSRMANKLPASIETVKIKGWICMESVENTVTSLRDAHEAGDLARLKVIIFSQSLIFDETDHKTAKALQDMCDGIGLELQLLGGATRPR